jgi:hypothetical protein
MEVSAKQAKRMVRYVEVTRPIITKMAETEAKIAELAPKVVDTLIEKGALDRSQRERAIVNIQDPVKALESLRKFASAQSVVKKASDPESMGSPVGEKTASDNGTSKMKESDALWLRRFGF